MIDIADVKRSVKIDFISQRLKTANGKKFTKNQLRDASDDALDGACKRFSKEFEEYINNPPKKLIKYFAEATVNETKDQVSFEGSYESETSAKEDIEKDGYTVTKIVPAKGHHLCRYCSGIAEGKDKNILCDACRELFGHTFYSEL